MSDDVRGKAESLGAKIVPGPNAMYASGFDSQDKINTFIHWLDDNGFDHGEPIRMMGSLKGTYDIRYSKY